MKVYFVVIEGAIANSSGKPIDVTKTVCEGCKSTLSNVTKKKEAHAGVYKCAICKKTVTVS